MTRSRIFALVIGGCSCAAVAVVIGISSSAAATSHPAHRRFATGATGFAGHHRGARSFGGLQRAVHAVAVVPNASGGFDTITIDQGKLVSVTGQQLKLTESSKTATYATPTITLPSDVKVRLDGKSSALAALVAGDRLVVEQSSAGTATVIARDGSFKRGATGATGATS